MEIGDLKMVYRLLPLDYRGIYEDLLSIEVRAIAESLTCGLERWLRFDVFIEECRQFRLDLLMRFYSPLGRVRV